MRDWGEQTRKATFIVSSCIIVLSFLPLINAETWWIRILDFPRLQVLLFGIAVLALHCWRVRPRRFLEKAVLLLLLASLIYQSSVIFPYTELSPKQVRDSNRLHAGISSCISILVANVLMTNRNAAAFLDLVRRTKPDLIFVSEADHWWERQLRPLEAIYPYAVKHPLENTYGVLLYSSLRLVGPRVKFLVEPDVPSIHSWIQLPGGHMLRLYGLHPRPPIPDEKFSTSDRDAELLIVGKQVKRLGQPAIVLGDLNDVAWSKTSKLFQRISGLLDPRIGRGIFNTFHAQNPLLRWPLDCIFHSEDFTVKRLERLDDFGSDHFPVYIELCMEPPGAKDPSTHIALEDQREIESIIQRIDNRVVQNPE